MSTTEVSPAAAHGDRSQGRIVNDFSIQVATVNGSGSQTANNVLMRSIFQMGVPVSGKNLFPSNIQGLPTWFTIRASKFGYIGRKKEIDFLVAMNRETAEEDVMSLDSGAAVVYDEPLKLDQIRSDLHFYPVPFDKLVAPVCPQANLRKLVRNMIYDGVVAHLLGIDLEEMHKALFKQFGPRKVKAAELNWGAVQAGAEFAEENLRKGRPAPHRAHGPYHRQDHHRRQRRHRPGRGLRRRHRGHLVSHHAVLLAGRVDDRFPQEAPASTRRPARQLTPWCRPRMNWPPSAW